MKDNKLLAREFLSISIDVVFYTLILCLFCYVNFMIFETISSIVLDVVYLRF